MAREPAIPLFLWIATAALAHILWGGGAERVANVLEDHHSVSRFAQSIRSHVVRANRPLEIELIDDPTADEERSNEGLDQPAEAKTEAPVEPQTTREPATPQERPPVKGPDAPDDPNREERPEEKENDRTPDPSAQPREKAEEPAKETEKEKPAVPANPQILHVDRRVAVRQHVEDQNQEDNPDAEFLGEHANRTKEQTQARITSMDQDEPEPHLGREHQGPSSDPGDAVVDEKGQSDDSPGDPNQAFAEAARERSDIQEQSSARANDSIPDPSKATFGETQPATRGQARGVEDSRAASKGRAARDERIAQEQNAKLLAEEGGSGGVVPQESEAERAQTARSAQRQRPAPKGNGGRLPALSGSQSLGLTPGGLNPNLTPLSALAVIGADQLSAERRADGERRRSKHRGSWHLKDPNRWRSAIENYVASVQPGNQTSLNTAKSSFANYLNRIHNRLHDVFAFEYLPSLDALPSSHALNRMDLATHIEIVLSREDGRIVRMGVTRASGSTMFDVGALESVQRAAPYGAPPNEIVSPDGNVYLHWEFHRNPLLACSTYFARPYILRVAPTPAPAPAPATPPAPLKGEEQHGLNSTPDSSRPDPG